MARLTKGSIDFTGSIGGVSAYKRRDMEGTIMRTKGGASKRKIKNSPSFERTRENNSEFAGRGRAAGRLRWALTFVRHLADYNFTSELSKLSGLMQEADKTNVKGERSILFSQHRDMLEGFRLNQKNPFDSVVRLPLKCEISRETASAYVQLPNLLPDINLYLPWKYPLFRFVISLQAVSDMHYNYPKLSQKDTDSAPAEYTAWQTTSLPYAGERIDLQLQDKSKLDDSWTFILAIGIEMGMPVSNTIVNTVKYVGCAKILTLG
ncbi:hypothetical protein SAMN05518672_10193 [Chitinophaga sp. CF118]|uniref:hypothetical protein n=1 Tax=Chitinophaga sp. CF118 TaxID=1884367 RepID=UPI0008E8FEA9|nr:hypothetical protein [Chitinophaga sp. CF118]SFD02425.1 hypothetical protein SAMN05518672_10193 [Chitinophaga sp. CF118]